MHRVHDSAGAAASMLSRRCRWLRERCKKIIADECQWHAAPLLNLAPAELIHQWKFVQRLIPVLIALMRSLFWAPESVIGHLTPRHLLSQTSFASS